ncbi:MAG: hypothetical protein AB7E85_00605 [Pseudobdellovibrionaceae bacterium]
MYKAFADELDAGLQGLGSFTQKTGNDYLAAAPDPVTAGRGMTAAFAKDAIAVSRGAIDDALQGMKELGFDPNGPAPAQQGGLLRTAIGVAIDTAVTGGIASALISGMPQFTGAIRAMSTAGDIMNGGRLASAAGHDMAESTLFGSFDDEEGRSFAGEVDPLSAPSPVTQTNAVPLAPAPAVQEATNVWRGQEMPRQLKDLILQERAHSEHIADVKHAVTQPVAPAFA